MTALGASTQVFTYPADLPGTANVPTYDGTASVLLYATDIAGNPIDTSTVTNKDLLVVDNTYPVIGFTYENLTNATAWADSARGQDLVRITAFSSEPIYGSPDEDNVLDAPTLKIETWEFSGEEEILIDELATISDGSILDTFSFEFEMPAIVGTNTEFTNYLTMTLHGSDWAGNISDSTDVSQYESSAGSFTLDNRAPEFTAFSYDDSVFINSVQLGWRNMEQLDEGWVTFDPVSAPGTGTPITLEGNELGRVPIPAGDLTNQDSLALALDDSNTYNIVFSGYDGVGNLGSDTIHYVAVDSLLPSCLLYTSPSPRDS